MNTSAFDPRIRARDVRFSADTLSVVLADGRTISAPLEWYPRLARATPEQRANWRLIGEGDGIHWPDVDEDISTIGLLEGWPSVEYRRAPTG
jgi:Protein of unknown function (DUF2442)